MPRGGVEVGLELYSFFNRGARREWMAEPHPGGFTPWKETHYPF